MKCSREGMASLRSHGTNQRYSWITSSTLSERVRIYPTCASRIFSCWPETPILKTTTGTCPKDQSFNSRKPWLTHIMDIWYEIQMIRLLEEGTTWGESAYGSVVDAYGFYLLATQFFFLQSHYLDFSVRSLPPPFSILEISLALTPHYLVPRMSTWLRPGLSEQSSALDTGVIHFTIIRWPKSGKCNLILGLLRQSSSPSPSSDAKECHPGAADSYLCCPWEEPAWEWS